MTAAHIMQILTLQRAPTKAPPQRLLTVVFHVKYNAISEVP